MLVRSVFAAVALAALASVAMADLITINVDPNGTTSNQTLFGTVIAGGSATWPAKSSAQWRDYQFELQTSSGTTTFNKFAVRLSASLRNQTPSGNVLQATLWSGTVVPNPLLADQLVTVSTPNASFTNGSSSYSSILLSGSPFTPWVISTTPSTFFFRVWAEGAGQNEGYQTKMAASLGEFRSVTMDPAPAIDGLIDLIDFDTDNDGLVDPGFIPGSDTSTRDLISEVPEPSSLAAAGLGGLLFAAWAGRTRRRPV